MVVGRQAFPIGARSICQTLGGDAVSKGWPKKRPCIFPVRKERWKFGQPTKSPDVDLLMSNFASCFLIVSEYMGM